jgi:hypothetical protein
MTPKPRLSMVELWRSQDPREWDYCESGHRHVVMRRARVD